MCNKTYPCDLDDFCPFEAEFNSSCEACRIFCGVGVDEDAPEESDDEDEDFDFEDEVDESMNPYDGTYEWQMEGNGFFDE